MEGENEGNRDRPSGSGKVPVIARAIGGEGSVIQRFAAAVVSRPFFYDLVQNLAGQKQTAARLASSMKGLPIGRVLDVGSSSGGLAFRVGLSPVCVDIDPRPLLRLRRLGRATAAIAGDAASLPFPLGTFDLTLFAMIVHHLDDQTLCRVLPELSRVTSGTLLLMEPLRIESRRVSRWLWRYDRGRYPRTREELLAHLQRDFDISEVSEFEVYHRYIICLGKPRQGPSITSEQSRRDGAPARIRETVDPGRGASVS